MTKTSSQQDRPSASHEIGFWAFLEYPVFWVPVVAFTILGAIGLVVAVFAGVR